MNKGLFGMLLISGRGSGDTRLVAFLSTQFFLVLFSVFEYTVCRAIKYTDMEVSL